MEDVLKALILFGAATAMAIVPQWLEDRRKRQSLEIVREALARGQTIDPALLARLGLENTHDPAAFFRRCLTAGVILTLLALGILGGWAAQPVPGMLLGASVLGSIGVAFLILAWATGRPRNERAGPEA